MDRREALKKMAVGGATVVGASTVLSSVAFANGGTANSQPTGTAGGTVTLTADVILGNKTARTIGAVLSGIPAGACAFGSPTTPRTEYAWSIVGGTNEGTISGTAFSPVLLPAVATHGIPNAGNWNGNFFVRLTIRWVCDQRPSSGGTAAWVCRSFGATVTATPDGGPDGTAVISATSEDVTPANCDTPVPLPS